MKDHSPSQMDKAIQALNNSGIRFRKVSEHQIKCGMFNFYPSKGTIFIDRCLQAESEKGLPAFIKMLEDARYKS